MKLREYIRKNINLDEVSFVNKDELGEFALPFGNIVVYNDPPQSVHLQIRLYKDGRQRAVRIFYLFGENGEEEGTHLVQLMRDDDELLDCSSAEEIQILFVYGELGNPDLEEWKRVHRGDIEDVSIIADYLDFVWENETVAA